MKKFEYFRPTSLKEASELLLKYGEDAHILNGGSDLIIRIEEGISNPEAVIDIKGIKELQDIVIDENGDMIIGACMNLNDIAHNELLYEKYDFLAEAAHMVGSSQVRNRATMIGNICNASPLADTATPLLALDAKVLIYGPEGEKEVSIHDFFVWVRKTCLKVGELVTGVKIPNTDKELKGIFQKHSRRKMVDLSTVCGTVVSCDNEFRIALGAVAPTPIRLRETEKFLSNKEITEEVIERAEEIAATEVAPIDDIRASKEYRIEMTKIIVRRGLKEVSTKELALAEEM